jgi:hypothetical protein
MCGSEEEVEELEEVWRKRKMLQRWMLPRNFGLKKF